MWGVRNASVEARLPPESINGPEGALEGLGMLNSLSRALDELPWLETILRRAGLPGWRATIFPWVVELMVRRPAILSSTLRLLPPVGTEPCGPEELR